MSTPILATKLYIPPTRPELVSRPRLIERLNEDLSQNQGFGRKLILISAPAGFGKTTLVSEWIGQCKMPAVWLSLDENDNDLVRFFSYVIAALQQIDTSIGQAVQAMLQSPQPPPIEFLMTALINEISAAEILATEISATPADARRVFVLDDYHLIDTQPIHEALTFLLDHLPPQMHLVIATREDPHLPLARLRVRGQLTELRAADLRFTSSEAAEFLNRMMGLDLSAEDIATLETRTEGWIAGLQLAAIALQSLGLPQAPISMQGHKDTTNFIKSFTGSHHFVLDYLVEEVFQRQPESVQTFLLHTSILDRLTGSLCDAVTDQDNGQATLEMLEHANLFIVPLDEERNWYRYHHLFADLLRRRLSQTQPEQVPTLHRRAGDWFAGQGLNREALHHTLVAEDYQRAADLIETLALDILHGGEHTTVSDWINALPDSLVRERPYLCVHHAWALQLTGQFDAAEARLSAAEEALTSFRQENEVETIRGYIHSHRAYLTFIRGEHAKTINYARQALEQLPPKATVIRTQTALYLGVAYRFQGELQAALDIFTETVAISQKMGGSITAVLSFLNLAELYTEQAHLHQARSIYEQALQFTKRHTGRPDMPFTGYVYVGIGRILRQWNELDNAYRYTTRGIALCRDWNVAEMLALSCIELAHSHHALGNDEQAREALQEAKRIFADISPWAVGWIAAYQARFDLARGDVEAAGRWAQASDLDVGDEIKFHQEVEYLTLARVLIAQNQSEQALSLLERLYQIDQASGRMGSVLEILMLQALALSAQGHAEQALSKLEQALAIGEPENYIRIFVDEGLPMATLLRQAIARDIILTYANKLLTAFPDFGLSPLAEVLPQSKIQNPKSKIVESLSERELEVLQLIADGFTNQEVAAKLFLSLNTVKVHTRNIYGKLGVHSRTQAIARSQELGLLPHK